MQDTADIVIASHSSFPQGETGSKHTVLIERDKYFSGAQSRSYKRTEERPVADPEIRELSFPAET